MRSGLKSPLVFTIVLVVIQILFISQLVNSKKSRSVKDITASVNGFLFAWELIVSRLNLLPYIFIPAPENVFDIFISDWKTILTGFLSSMELILAGLFLSVVSSVVLGTLVGYNKRLTNAVYPIAKALSTVPALIYTPYIVLIMPTFKLASLTVIFLSIFWGSFMGSINNTAFVEKKIINAAKVLNLSVPTILFKIIIPFNLPRIINALPIHLATSLMTLTVAEMLGADSGMGYYVRVSLNYANYTKAIAGIIFIGFVVTILNIIIQETKKHLIKWNY
ncbi:MAG: ABC transporter permease subunit [Treponema sp.]|jgi:NitT/TauT family transport system permease protein|nr:ABC transporter permease subunit [Treponema sp.]